MVFQQNLPRLTRVFAALALVTTVVAGLKADSVPSIPNTFPPHRPAPTLMQMARLRLHHLHTGESIDVAYKQNGEYLQSGMDMLNHFLRDHRTNETASYDPREFDLLHSLLVKLGRPNATINIVCGYRSPWSNNFLRTRSAETGVAEHSQHILSKAIDIQIPGVSTRAIRDAALSLGMGGVGYYPISHFVHVDVGPVRQWQFGGYQLASRGSGRRGHGRRHRA